MEMEMQISRIKRNNRVSSLFVFADFFLFFWIFTHSQHTCRLVCWDVDIGFAHWMDSIQHKFVQYIRSIAQSRILKLYSWCWKMESMSINCVAISGNIAHRFEWRKKSNLTTKVLQFNSYACTFSLFYPHEKSFFDAQPFDGMVPFNTWIVVDCIISKHKKMVDVTRNSFDFDGILRACSCSSRLTFVQLHYRMLLGWVFEFEDSERRKLCYRFAICFFFISFSSSSSAQCYLNEHKTNGMEMKWKCVMKLKWNFVLWTNLNHCGERKRHCVMNKMSCSSDAEQKGQQRNNIEAND